MSDTYPPPPAFAARARINAATVKALHLDRVDDDADRLAYWSDAAEALAWRTHWHTLLDWNPPRARWFVGGTLNATESCLDRHLSTWRRNKAAIIWEGEPMQGARPTEVRTLTYQQLHDEVCRFAGALRALGVELGDRVCIYMPLVPEAVIAMLACARLGATHSVVFGGFSAEALRDRIHDSQCKVVVTADGGARKGQIVRLKDTVDQALSDPRTSSIQHVVVLKRTGHDVNMVPKRDLWWDDANALGAPVQEAVAVDAEHPLFILYTSGTTGKPKGVVHSTGGFLTGVSRSYRFVFDHKDEDIFWCSADVGWVTGHSYVAYGPLCNGATIFLYEGAPTHPEPNRFWEMIERHRISILYTAPTAIRTFMRLGDQHVKQHDLSSLRLLGSVGEPINPEAWRWYHDVVGGGRCPIVDTWWQTETGSIMASPLPGLTTTKPGSCMKALPGIDLCVVRPDGLECDLEEQGLLVSRKPWPSMMLTVWGDDERYRQTYWSQLKDPVTGDPWYFTGDGARFDKDGALWISGRVDDVVNVAGHRLGTAEIESALVLHPAVAEAAVVGRPDEVRGQAIVAFVTLKASQTPSEALKAELSKQVASEIGSFARPDEIRWANALPKTRSGKIMRRLLRELATKGRVDGDMTSLEDFGAIAALQTEDA
ncbi:MAG: acetate--CoA ligase [Deltaproteobacteria bacterium]|nr:acetate--CoA ligase [Deltaproteobacteria bacterium]